MFEDALECTKSILDPVHGLIRLRQVELQVVNSTVFQRLRRIKQNGLLSFIFPAATHTRFEHSLGAMFVANSMLEALFRNSQIAARKGETGSGVNEASDLAALSNENKLSLAEVTRLAALCHDLGHGPFSHTFESFAPLRSKVVPLLEKSPSKALQKLSAHIPQSHDRVEHEWFSCILFAECLQEIEYDSTRRDNLILEVAAAITGVESLSSQPSLTKLIHDLVASSPADADRMDYAERDSRSCGVSYGLFDRARVLKSLLCYRDDTGAFRLGVKASGFRAIENFVQARFELFVQIYFHKTNRAIEQMLGQIGTLGAKENIEIFSCESLTALMKDYRRIGDEQFLAILCGESPGHAIPPQIAELAVKVRDRKLWRRVEDFRESRVAPDRQDEFLMRLKKETNADLVLDSVPPKATKGLAEGAALLSRNAKGVYAKTSVNWLDISPLMKTLTDEERTIRRIYYRGFDPKTAKAVREKALELEKEFTP